MEGGESNVVEVESNNKKVKKKGVAEFEKYVDDNELYNRRYDELSRLKYWEHIVTFPFKPKMPRGFIGWAEQSKHEFELEIVHFNPHHVLFLNCVTSAYWDMTYICSFGLFIVLVILYYDKYLESIYELTYPSLFFPLAIMFCAQIIPSVGAVVIITKMNDLTKVCARKRFGDWVSVYFFICIADLCLDMTGCTMYLICIILFSTSNNGLFIAQAFTSVIISQYIEYTYYGGHRREHMAGTCKLDPKYPLVNQSFCESLASLLGTTKKVAPYGECEPEGDAEEEESHNDYHGNNNRQNSDQFDEVSLMSMEESIESGEGGSAGGRHHPLGIVDAPPQMIHSLGGDETSLVTNDSAQIITGGYLKRLQEEAAQKLAETKRLAALEKSRQEEFVRDWMEWKCIVCNKENRRPRHPPPDFTICFSSKGQFYKRTVAKMIKHKDIPVCTFCHTPADYQPRLCTSHLFPHNPNPYAAFENYPESVPSIPRHFLLRYVDKTVSFFFGQRNHPDSKLMQNDWRLSMYLSSRFPAVARPVKPNNALFEIGEIVECRHHKVDWTRARILVSRPSKIYDIM
jgi:hypothetical protein